MFYLDYVLISTVLLFHSGCSETGTSTVTMEPGKAFIIDISAKKSTKKNPVSFELDAGEYRITVIGVADGGAFNSWKPWFHREKQGEDGTWKKGWVNKYNYSSDEFPEVTCSDGIVYGTPALALAHASGSRFTLEKKTTVNFYISDAPSFDNSGGISLLVEPVVPSGM